MRRYLLGASALAGALTALAVWAGSGDEPPSLTVMGETVGPAAIELGREVYAESCASCHGAELEGQPDWRRRLESGRMPAPPHDETGHTWHHADGQLFTITKQGVGAVVPGYESDMPVFEGILSDDEIIAVLAYIKSTWPERERAFQAEVTANAEEGS